MNEGDRIPRLNLVNTELKNVDLSSVAKGSPTIIAFFPGAFTSVCTKEMCRFRDDMQQLNSMKGKVYAISVDGPFPNKEFKEKNKLNFEVLSDYNREAVRAFKIELKDFAQMHGYTAAKRAVFIADSNGVIRFKWVTDDPTVEPNYEAVKAALSAIK